MSALRLMLNLGIIPSPWHWLVKGFYFEYFPKGTGFAEVPAVPAIPEDLPVAEVEAFSIDDSQTTEIDDAASVTDLPDGKNASAFISRHRH